MLDDKLEQSTHGDRLMTRVRDLAPRRHRVWASKSPGKLVVRYADGRVLKGYSADFDPDAASFHLVSADGDEDTEICLKELKAVFFVRSFEGEPSYSESKDLYAARPPATRKVCVEFEDGEMLVGYTRGMTGGGRGVFFYPLDPASNNVKVFASLTAVLHVTRLL